MKFLEEFGVKKIEEYYNILTQKEQKRYSSVSALFGSSYIIKLSILAFLIGFFSTVPIIWFEVEWRVFDTKEIEYKYIVYYIVIFTLLVLVEFYLLFILGFYSIAYYIFHLQYIKEIDSIHLTQEEFLALFSRTVMELPEHHKSQHNINHHELNNFDIATFSIVYKLKVILSNFLLKFIAKKLLTRSSLRIYIPYLAAVGTGIWDGVVFYKSVKHAHYKIMVRYTIDILLKEKIDILIESEHIKAMLSRYYYYGEYNNNFEYLLHQISYHAPIDYNKDIYLQDGIYPKCNEKLLALIFCFRENLHSKKERELIESIGNKELLKETRKALKRGDTNYIDNYISQL